ncbi:hypothetical protein [Sulfurovum sp.]|uniref:hypothetical protein n=1 Tax=Sulfurovum sp. TaxID=1969726 RepID=UPI002867D9A7|nr:hypothetical protein [Sulfurovum sp.]
MYTHIKRFALLSLLLLLTACSTSSTLKYENSNLNLQIEDKRIQVPSTQVKSTRENFSSLFLEQKLLRLNDGSLVMFEEAETDMQYTFNHITTRTISVVFDAIKAIKIYEKNFIYAYQLVLKDQRVLNIIVSQGYDQELQMVYGMSTKQFITALNRLNANISTVPYPNAIQLKNEPNPLLSNWTTWKVSFYPLVIPVRLMGRM